MLNQVAQKVIDERRGIQPEFVFTYSGQRGKKYGGGFRPGDTNGDITTHYSAVELAELINAVNKIDRSLATPAITLLRSAA